MTSSTIKYRITSVTSESPNYPAQNLTDQSSTLGWQSQYSPTYPQQLNIQFFTPIRTKTLKLTFHQYKIPSLVQVFVRLTSKENFRKLGYLVPNDNTQSSFEQKEIKTLYFEFPCNFVKLVFYQNYKNEMNLLEQVAVESLQVEGEAMTYNEIRNLDLMEEPTSADESDKQFNNKQTGNRQAGRQTLLQQPNLLLTVGMQQLSKKFSQVYSKLESEKSQAVQNQDFRLAAHLKNAIQTFRNSQKEIASLQIQKREALQEQDFDRCHRIKQQIQKKKEEFEYRVEQLAQNEDNFMAEYSHSRISNDPQQSIQRKQMHTQRSDTQQPTDAIKNYFSSTPQKQQSYQRNKSIIGKKLQGELKTNKSQVQLKQVVDHNEQIIPAVRNKMLGIKVQQEYEEFPPNKSQFIQQRNKSVIGDKSGLMQRKQPSRSPDKRNRSKSPSKSPTRHQSSKQHTYLYRQRTYQSNVSLKSPILSYQQLQYERSSKKQLQSIQLGENQNELTPNKPSMNELHQRLRQLKVEPLDMKLRLQLQCHFTVIEQPYWMMIMHKGWSTKKQALQCIRDNLIIQNKQSYMATLQFISFSISDTHPQVLLSTLNLLRKTIQQGNSHQVQFTLPHLPYFIETIVNSLLTLINSTNKQLSQQAYNIYLLLGMISFLSIQYLVQRLVKHKHTTKTSPQYNVMKIGLMISLIERYNQSTKCYKEILLWAIEFLKDPNNKVRSQASYILLILVDLIGEDKVVNVIKDKPQLMQLYLQTLNNSQLIQNSSRMDSLSNIGDGSRVTDRNQSKIEDNPSSVIPNKSSRDNQQGIGKNKSQLSQNPSSLAIKQQQQSKRLSNPWTKNEQQIRPREIHRQKTQQRNQDELQYSKESDFYDQSAKKHRISSRLSDAEIPVLEEEEEVEPYDIGYQQEEKFHQQQSQNEPSYRQQGDQQEQGDEDNTKCDYCFMDMRGMDQRQHLLTQCKVLVSCQQCLGRVYIRQTINHLLEQCANHTHHQQCRKCGLVFNIGEINEHVGQGLCRLQRGDGWERCQFCGQDVMANDMKWVDHAYKCTNLPEVHLTQKHSQLGD